MIMSLYKLNLQEIRNNIPDLAAGDMVELSGVCYTARDAAHKRIFELLDRGEKLPFELKDACIYFAGPTPAPANLPIGSCGPTTAGRMDPYSPRLLDLGLAAMIGKGERSEKVREAVVRNCSVYFCALGGAGALYAKHITSLEEIAFPELGCESVKRLTVSEFPVFVGIDCRGNTVFEEKKL